MSTTDEMFGKLKKSLDSMTTVSDQKAAIKQVFMIFLNVSKNKNMPDIKVFLVDFLKRNYPDLEEDINKLLILS